MYLWWWWWCICSCMREMEFMFSFIDCLCAYSRIRMHTQINVVVAFLESILVFVISFWAREIKCDFATFQSSLSFASDCMSLSDYPHHRKFKQSTQYQQPCQQSRSTWPALTCPISFDLFNLLKTFEPLKDLHDP